MSELEAPAGRVPELAYLRVADDIAARIGSGELTAKARLRAERELADHYGVAYGTIRRAMKELRARGLVASVQGRGTFVAARISLDCHGARPAESEHRPTGADCW